MLEMGLALSGAALRGPSWSPAALFGGGANGFWLDPGRIAGVWQDAAGTVHPPQPQDSRLLCSVI